MRSLHPMRVPAIRVSANRPRVALLLAGCGSSSKSGASAPSGPSGAGNSPDRSRCSRRRRSRRASPPSARQSEAAHRYPREARLRQLVGARHADPERCARRRVRVRRPEEHAEARGRGRGDRDAHRVREEPDGDRGRAGKPQAHRDGRRPREAGPDRRAVRVGGAVRQVRRPAPAAGQRDGHAEVARST